MSETTPSTVSKPSDINNILKGSQEVIDAAVSTVTETRKTQEILKYNISITDQKVSDHNASPESHEDIRIQLADMPKVITDPVISGPNSIETGTEGTWNLASSPSPLYTGTISITKFTVYDAKGQKITDIPTSDGSANFVHTFTGKRNEQTYFQVQAVGGINSAPEAYTSNRATQNFTITQHLPPDMSGMSCTIPSNITEGHVYSFRIANIVDLDGDLENVTISCTDPHLTFSETTVQLNTDYTLTVDEGYNGPADITITFTAHDTLGLSATKSIKVHLNAIPVVSGFGHTFPTYPNPNSNYTFKVFGATDPDGETENLTCRFSSEQPITFSKSEGVKLNEDVTAIIGDIAANTPITIAVTVVDPADGQASTTISSVINSVPVMTGFIATQQYTVWPLNVTGTISFSGATDINGEAITYSLVNNYPSELTFSKTSGITENEVVNVTISSSAVRGQSYIIPVTATDASQGSATANVTIKINSLPDVTNLACTLDTYLIPGKMVEGSVSGATDVDGQNVTYTVTSDNPNVILGNATNIAAGAAFSVTPPSEEDLARGDSFNLIFTVSDGFETSTRTIAYYQNRLVDASSIVTTLPTSVQGGAEHAVQFTISGGSDADGHDFTYNITGLPAGVSVSKDTGIAAGESVKLTATKVATDTPMSFTITATDSLGEVSTTSQTISFTVVIITVTAPPTITAPVDGAKLEYDDGVDMAWTEFATMIDTDNDHAYPWN